MAKHLQETTITQADVEDAVGKKHAHANSSALDLVSGTNTGDQNDHGLLNGLSDDDHTQYALLSGRNGDNIVTNGTLGSELVSNGDFASDTVWSKGTGWAIGSGTANYTGPNASSVLSQTISVTSGNTYLLTFTITAISGGSIAIRVGGLSTQNIFYSTAGTFKKIIKATSTGSVTLAISVSGSGVTSASIDNVSVKQVTGGTTTVNNTLVVGGQIKVPYGNSADGVGSIAFLKNISDATDVAAISYNDNSGFVFSNSISCSSQLLGTKFTSSVATGTQPFSCTSTTKNDNLNADLLDGNHASAFPIISSGTAAPGTTPGKVGDMYVDTTNKKIYVATGASSSADWTILN